MGKSGIFKDITGLTENQKNAIETYRTNSDAAQAIAETASITAMATELAAGRAKGKQSVADRVAKAAVEQNREMSSTVTDPDGSSQTLSLKGKPQLSPKGKLAEVGGYIQKIRQPTAKTCWAAALAMMISWKRKVPVDLEAAVSEAGGAYVDRLKSGAALRAADGPELLSRVGLVSETGDTHNYNYTFYGRLMDKYSPLWLTIDSTPGRGWSPHAIILTRIDGYAGAPDEEVIFSILIQL
jgi:hypothetical protein